MVTERRRAAELLHSQLVNEVIAEIEALPDDCRQSGDDSPLNTVWLEYSAQVQGPHSGIHWAYVSTIESICQAVAEELSDGEIRLLCALDDEASEGGPLEQIVRGLKREVDERAVNLQLPP